MNKIILPATSPYVHKDQLKADMCNKFIGVGSPSSSTEAYRKAFHKHGLANCRSYEAADKVFISAEGNRRNRVPPDFAEIRKAVDAGVTFITDKEKDRTRPYNVGEREVAAYLAWHQYKENNGIWTK